MNFSTVDMEVIEPTNPPSVDVHAIVSYSKGFACSGETGTIWLFEKTGEKDYYIRTRLIKVS